MYHYMFGVLHPKCGGWVGACAMIAPDCSVSLTRRRGAIDRGHTAYIAWKAEAAVSSWVLPATTGFILGWFSCFFWLLLPTVSYAN